jgi:hypothetical protein
MRTARNRTRSPCEQFSWCWHRSNWDNVRSSCQNWTMNFLYTFQLQENGFEPFKNQKKLGMDGLNKLFFPCEDFKGTSFPIRSRLREDDVVYIWWCYDENIFSNTISTTAYKMVYAFISVHVNIFCGVINVFWNSSVTRDQLETSRCQGLRSSLVLCRR